MRARYVLMRHRINDAAPPMGDDGGLLWEELTVPLRVVVADDDAEVRAGLCAVLEDDERFTVVGEAADAAHAVEVAVREQPNAVLVDVRMPGGGVEAATRIRDAGVVATVVAVSAKVDAATVAALLHAGVRGIFLKGRLGLELADMLERCCSGQVLLTTPTAWDGLRAATAAHG